MSSIPNVSSIYRDLAHISTTVLPNQNTPSPSNQYSPYSNTNNRNQIEQKYDYKQRRHNQLLGKFKNSYQEQRGLLNIDHRPNLQVSYQQSNQQIYNQSPSYDYSPQYSHNNFQATSSQRSRNNFVIPKIKYRHLEDQKKNSGSQVNQLLQTTLQRQFYEDHNKQNTVTPQQRNTHRAESPKDDQLSETSSIGPYRNGDSRMNKTVNYEQKIQSYYELCRKNLSSKHIKQNKDEKPGTEKFIRNQKSKTKAMKLQDALKILSVD